MSHPTFARGVVAAAALALSVLITGCSPPSFIVKPTFAPDRLEAVTVDADASAFAPRIAVIEVEGLLLNVRTSGFLGSGENKVATLQQKLDLAAKDPAVKAIVLRINSPGGGVTASDIIYRQVKDFRESSGKPVVAAAQDVCASGAYYVALAADELIVEETSLVGSIGVIFTTFDASGLMSKIGVQPNVIKSGQNKDLGSLFRPMSPPDRQLLQDIVNEYYARFRSLVADRYPAAAARPDFANSTDGRVFSGTKAVELGLADATGTLQDAIHRARELAKIDSARVIMYRRGAESGSEPSIYAAANPPASATNELTLRISGIGRPVTQELPGGFYLLWEPR
jgi:protease-4